ncbi:TonB-dependent receptor plug domain-containing protein [Aureliella helgolandensis]|uniref:Colicin I receptor n=1 Tax=Aureliella helgolandensis TaxID=2527968 RepID=A0A518GEK2_9BACT|nr:TonB-dependent receptor [Aureliella helgolandensis]QDV27023.1 Colicin I receptor precursor [Aureliella helgolandensis]
MTHAKTRLAHARIWLCSLALAMAFQGTMVGQTRPPTPATTEDSNSANLATEDLDSEDILDLDIEALGKVDVVVNSFDVEVTSVTRSESTVGRSPAAVFVLTNEMIRRSGATSIPEALRLVPGLTVARLTANKWAVSSRGFSGEYANKLLVLQDGRSLYSLSHSGVTWGQQDAILEDIERIEVIRGPGASVWGSNAVNGVINIITKDASQTQGTLISAGGGSEDKTITSLRHGNQLSDRLHYRIYGKHFERDRAYSGNSIAADDWRMGRVGTRADWSSDDHDTQHLTVMAELHSAVLGEYVDNAPIPTAPFIEQGPYDDRIHGGFASLRWREMLSEDSQYSFQTYFDRRHLSPSTLATDQDILDVDFQHVYKLLENHTWTWGTGYQCIWTSLNSEYDYRSQASPALRQTNLYSGFFQDQIELREDLQLVLGCKFEHNTYTQFEYQPTVRLLHAISDRQVVWGAVSRAIRTPNRTESDLTIRLATEYSPLTVLVSPNDNLEAEDLLSFELGYRAQPHQVFSWDAVGFIHRYEDLIVPTATAGLTGSPPILPLQFRNDSSGTSYGTEWFARWQPDESWNFSSGYSFIAMDLTETLYGKATQIYTRNQLTFQSLWNVTEDVELDSTLRYVDNIPGLESPSYIALDLRLGCRLTPNCNLSLVGQNLLDSHRQDSVLATVYSNHTEVQRGVYGQLTWEF